MPSPQVLPSHDGTDPSAPPVSIALPYSIRRAFRENPLREPWRTALTVAVLFVLLATIYFHIGLGIEAHDSLRDNVFFHSDAGRVLLDMTRFVANHDRTSVHPLFVLMTQPLAAPFVRLWGSPERAALALNAAAGGLCVALACLFFRAAGQPLRRATLAALVFGVSASNLYFGSAPETFIWSALGLILLFLGVLWRPGQWRWFLPAGLIAFGALITNLATVALTFAASEWLRRPIGVWFKRVVLFTGAVVLVAAVLALGQRAIWPSSHLFFVPASIEHEQGFMPPDRHLAALAARDATLLRYIYIYDFFAPKTYIEREGDKRPALQIRARSLSYLTVPGKFAAALWLAGLAAAIWATVKFRLFRRPIVAALLLSTLANFVLHTLYGDDLFLYSTSTTFPILAWLVLCVAEWRERRAVLTIDAMLAIIVVFEVWNNYPFARAIYTMQSHGH